MHVFNWGWGHGPFWGGGIFMVIFWICLIFLVVSFIRSPVKERAKKETAIDILKKRYATGDITREEFEQVKIDIQS